VQACERARYEAALAMSGSVDQIDPDPGNTTRDASGLPWIRPDPHQDWDSLVMLQNATNVTYVGAPSGWTGEAARLAAPSNGTSLYRIRLHPLDAAAHETKWFFRQEKSIDAPRCDPLVNEFSNFLVEPAQGETAMVGKGVLVYAAGFWTNGTMFYTNMPNVHTTHWPRGGIYAWEGGDPLPVYVYDSSRAEKPAYWSVCPPAPLGNGTCVWNYYTTIEGFNEALKGMSTNTARVVRIPAEKAYTFAGNENHPLYGDALIFYIRILEVRDMPCGDSGPLSILCNPPGPRAEAIQPLPPTSPS